MEREGGLGGVRDTGLLDAAVAMPRQQFGGEYLHGDIPAMAAAYLFHLCMNHPFHDGNKRAAVMAAFVFLDANGFELEAAPKEVENVVLEVASGEMSKERLTDWMRQSITERPTGS